MLPKKESVQWEEENKTTDSFQWTDFLVEEFAMGFLASRTMAKMSIETFKNDDRYKQSHTPKAESYSSNDGKLTLPKHIAEQLKPQAENKPEEKYGKNYFDMPKSKPQEQRMRGHIESVKYYSQQQVDELCEKAFESGRCRIGGAWNEQIKNWQYKNFKDYKSTSQNSKP